MNISTRGIVVAGILIAVTILLSVTPIGYIPVPNVTGAATILQVPTIIGAVLEGPVIGGIIGIVFGITSYLLPSTQVLFADRPFWVPIIVLILPRVLIAVISYYTYVSMRKNNEILALGVASVLGTLTNTVGVVGLGVLFSILPAEIIPAIIPQAIAEVVIAAVLTIAVVAAYKGIARGRAGSTV